MGGFQYDEEIAGLVKAAESGTGEGGDNAYLAFGPRYEKPNAKQGPIPYRVRIVPSFEIVRATAAKRAKVQSMDQELMRLFAPWWVKTSWHSKEVVPGLERKILCPRHSDMWYMNLNPETGGYEIVEHDEDAKRCAFCELRDAALASGKPGDNQFAYGLRASVKMFMNAYDEDDLDQGVKFLALTGKVYDTVRAIDLNRAFGPITDPANGRVLQFTITEKPKTTYWEYGVQVEPDKCPIAIDGWEDQLGNIRARMFSRPMEYEKGIRLIRGESPKEVFSRQAIQLSESENAAMRQSYLSVLTRASKSGKIAAPATLRQSLNDVEIPERAPTRTISTGPKKFGAPSSTAPKTQFIQPVKPGKKKFGI